MKGSLIFNFQKNKTFYTFFMAKIWCICIFNKYEQKNYDYLFQHKIQLNVTVYFFPSPMKSALKTSASPIKSMLQAALPTTPHCFTICTSHISLMYTHQRLQLLRYFHLNCDACKLLIWNCRQLPVNRSKRQRSVIDKGLWVQAGLTTE